MPKLILFAACEKVIVDHYDNSTSLITLLEAINIAVRQEDQANIPDDAGVPLNWYLLALWQVEPGDEAITFESRFAAQFTSGEESELSITPFQFEQGKPNFRNVLRVVGLRIKPLITSDAFTAKVSIRRQGTEQWEDQGSFPVLVRHPKEHA